CGEEPLRSASIPPPFFFSSRRRHTRWPRDWSSDVCSSDLFLRAVNPRVAVLHSPRVRNLAETHQTRHEIVQPLHHAFRPADGEYKIVLLFPVPRDESVELGFLAPPEKIIRHVEPSH